MSDYVRSTLPTSRAASSSSRPAPSYGGPSGAGRKRGSKRPSNSMRGREVRPSAAAELDRLLDEALQATPPEAATFAELGIPAPLVAALRKRGIDAPFAIQTRAIPDAVAGRDVLGRAQTGGGKTLAFGLPLLARLASSHTPRVAKAPRALVLVPTRELATQVADALRPLGEAVGLKLACVFGGAPYGRQIDSLTRGVDLVVATPGRLIDLIERGSCSLDRVEITVLDEADHMADLGFMPAVTGLLDQTKPGGQRLLFSATLDRGVDKLVRGYLKEPALHAVAPASSPIEAMEHRVFTVKAEDKLAVMTEVAGRPGRTLIFVRTKHGADRLAGQLDKAGVRAAAIHGNLKQNARQRALDGFAAGMPRVLVATDVAARGIHVDDVDLVVHFDPPNDAKDYLHRSGRTARAGATGTALALALPHEIREVAALHRTAGVQAISHAVHPGHTEVVDLGASGTPIVVVPVVAREGSGSDRSGRERSGGSRRPRSGGYSSGGYSSSGGSGSYGKSAEAGAESSRPRRQPFRGDDARRSSQPSAPRGTSPRIAEARSTSSAARDGAPRAARSTSGPWASAPRSAPRTSAPRSSAPRSTSRPA
jgi:superfamily II DNA/RNA helicase